MINSKDINDLLPIMQEKCKLFIKKCKDINIDVIITSTYRDFQYQNSLYEIGRTKSGKIVTNAKGGESQHNYRRAFDFCIIQNGKANWGNILLYKQCGDIATSIGLVYGGNWSKFKEFVHCELPK